MALSINKTHYSGCGFATIARSGSTKTAMWSRLSKITMTYNETKRIKAARENFWIYLSLSLVCSGGGLALLGTAMMLLVGLLPSSPGVWVLYLLMGLMFTVGGSNLAVDLLLLKKTSRKGDDLGI